MLFSVPARKVLVVLASLAFIPLMGFALTHPEAFLGHKVGADRKLADYGQIKAYFEKLDQESPKLRIEPIGTSTQGKSIIMAIITSEENMAKLDTIRETAKRLKEARGLSPQRARHLAKGGRG